MSIIIANRPSFVLVYDEESLPQFNPVVLHKYDENGELVSAKPRNMNILLSQLVACAIREDYESYESIKGAYYSQIRFMKNNGGHEKQLAIEYENRLIFALENVHDFAPRYVAQWQAARK